MDLNGTLLLQCWKDLEDQMAAHKHSSPDAVILSGGPMMLTEEVPYLRIQVNLVALMTLACPILGICFGAQIMATLYGGHLKRIKTQHTKEPIVFRNVSLTVQTYYSDSIAKAPSQFQVSGMDKSGRIMAFERWNTGPYRMGVLFHPEATPEGHQILDYFLRISQTLSTKTDQDFV